MRKIFNGFIFLLIATFSFVTPSLAINLSLDELGEEIDKINPYTDYVYICGEYVFTSKHILTTQDTMLSSRSIDAKDKIGKTNQDAIYNEMTIHQLRRIYDDNFNSLGWEKSVNLVGKDELSDNLNISYIDYQEIKEPVIYTVTFNNDGEKTVSEVKEGKTVLQPSDPQKDNYKFIGWYDGDNKYDFNTKVTKNIDLIAKYVKYDKGLIEAEAKTTSMNSGKIEMQTVYKTNNHTENRSMLAEFSELTKVVYMQIKTLMTGEDNYEDVLELYEVIKDNKDYTYYKIMDEDSKQEKWYLTINELNDNDNIPTNYKTIEKVTSEIEGQEKYKYTLDKDDYVVDNNSMVSFKDDIIGYAYVQDGYVVKNYIDYKLSLDDIEKQECEEYITTWLYSKINQNDDFNIPQDVVDNAILIGD